MMEESHAEKKSRIESLLHFYEIKMLGYGSYSTLVWGRFNWLLTLELALLGFYFTKVESIEKSIPLHLTIPIAGIVISVIWGILGWKDYHSLDRHKVDADILHRKLNKLLDVDLQQDKEGGGGRVRQTWLLYVLPGMLLLGWFVLFIMVFKGDI